MRTLAAPGDTWGISGPDFLAVYGGALAVFVVVALVWRIRAIRAGGTGTLDSPTPGQIAMLQGGPARAVYAALAGLRAAGVVEAGPARTLQVTGPAPAGLSRLDHAVYEAASRRIAVSAVADDTAVRSALDELSDGLVRAGWVLDSTQRARARLGAWLVLALAGFGLARVVAGVANDRPVTNLVLLLVLTTVIGLVLLAVPRGSSAGKRAVLRLRTANAHLAPNQSPAWATYGVTGAAMGVALFGTSALWAADPAFAGEAGIRRESIASSGGDSGGGDSGGGDSGGGGGGCGGGGCGG